VEDETMKLLLTREERDAAILHAAFSALCIPVLLIPGLATGIKLFILVVAYNIALPVTAKLRGYDDWLNIWLFAIILSAFQVFPDWFLSHQLGVLVFPEDGFVKIGTVSGYMAGLWAVPIFVIVYSAERVIQRISPRYAYWAAALLALVIFGVSEETVWMLPSWYAQNVIMVSHTALYIIIPEIILGVSCLYAFEQVREKKNWIKIPAAFLVMQLYLGSAAFFYFIVERLAR
jgi:ABC-type spermidine/putrescine transport system permease subunit II